MIRRIPMQDPRMGGGHQKLTTDTIPAAVGGLNSVMSLAAMAPISALQLDNWICRPDKLQMRRGCAEFLTGLSNPVRGFGAYYGGAKQRLFAFTDDGIYDCSAAGVAGAPVSTIHNGNCVAINYATSAAQFLVVVNGVDPYRYYNGSTWTEVATFSNDDGLFLTQRINNVMHYNQRLFFAVNNDLKLWYLDPNGTIQGGVKSFPLGLVCKRGGRLVAMETWTIDSGSGLDDRLVLITSEGEVAIYSGTDPGDADRWTLQGVYYIGRPLGKKCMIKYGGDVLILTERGLFPLSKAVQSVNLDKSSALTYNIEPDFARLAASLYYQDGWEMCINFNQSLLLVNVPSPERLQLVMQLQSGGWSKITGWEANAFVMLNGEMYFGASDHVAHCFYGSSDYGNPIVAVERLAYNYFGARGQVKDIRLVRPILETDGVFTYSLGASVDYEGLDPDQASSTLVELPGIAIWDEAVWDEAVWAEGSQTITLWESPAIPPATAISLYLRISSVGAQVSHIATDVGFIVGGVL